MILLFFGIKTFRWKLAICQMKNNKVKILKIFNPGFFEFWADPFFVKYAKKNYIFFESYNYFLKKGNIQCLEIKNNQIVDKKIVLDEHYHLSYPHIFKLKKNFYLIPESYEDKKTSIYISLRFPFKWKKIQTIFEGEKVCDTTITYKNNKFWLFVNKSKNNLNEFNKKLFIYSSKNFDFKKLIPHKDNPVNKSLKNSRNAGSIFYENKVCYRPAQINKKNIYGYGFFLNKIVRLSQSNFKQIKILEITPKQFDNKNICGIHHYSKIDKNTFLTDLCFRYSFF